MTIERKLILDESDIKKFISSRFNIAEDGIQIKAKVDDWKDVVNIWCELDLDKDKRYEQNN